MNKEYLIWLRQVKNSFFARHFDELFWNWLRAGEFRSMYEHGFTVEEAEWELVPW